LTSSAYYYQIQSLNKNNNDRFKSKEALRVQSQDLFFFLFFSAFPHIDPKKERKKKLLEFSQLFEEKRKRKNENKKK